MRTVRMTAKKAGKCRQCNSAIEPGDLIFWRKGHGAWHVDCEASKLRHTGCTNCGGSGLLWNNAPCRQCDGTGSRKIEDFARSGGHPVRDPMGVDTAYEDSCARQCGL